MSQPAPDLFIDTAFAYQKTGAIKAAIGLGIFTAIGNEAKTVGAISKSTGAAPKGVRVLCDYGRRRRIFCAKCGARALSHSFEKIQGLFGNMSELLSLLLVVVLGRQLRARFLVIVIRCTLVQLAPCHVAQQFAAYLTHTAAQSNSNWECHTGGLGSDRPSLGNRGGHRCDARLTLLET
jgi:hypothetical protein